MFWEINIKNGIVTYDDISFLDDNFKSLEQINYLKEDMLQIEFPGSVLLDVGWRPSFNEDGRFYVSMIKNFDWENPIEKDEAFNVTSLKEVISKFIEKNVP